ncbi:MAG: hypothetical protein HQK56_20645 [Deltaproteobacteria bacterium]|nr:hypothetical protein [Deltaproteobacteria bacterium]
MTSPFIQTGNGHQGTWSKTTGASAAATTAVERQTNDDLSDHPLIHRCRSIRH